MKFENIKTVYFLGIGGIGMSAIARYFNHAGKRVMGYDKTPTPLTQALVAEGIDVHFEDKPEWLESLQLQAAETLVVLTPAIPKDHKEWAWFIHQGFQILKRSQVLGILSESFTTAGVAGTHGKTTTSTMLAHLLKQSHLDCSAFLGGISVNYSSNLLLGSNAANPLLVVEADEFDRSFLTLHPFVSLITSTDADHLDIYGEHDALKASFLEYASRLKEGGTLYVKQGLNLQPQTKGKVFTYGLNSEAQVFAFNIRIEGDLHQFDLNFHGEIISGIELGIPGLHNIENAVGASALALTLGVSHEELKQGLASFRGVKRRFEYIVKRQDCIVIDDYAHHPEELRAILGSVKRMYPNRKLTAAFQPHLFTRTRDFADGFAEVLGMADELHLLEIYPARELPIPGVNSQMLLDRMPVQKGKITGKQELVDYVCSTRPELLLILGAGDIDALVEPIKLGLA
ncbi:MAG: UDP-N-acetylmuramate--L-alanine ligase [Bacteroidetes bacterium]|nr:UDP-N-acetylmuramate--L-alanine ligase [Bacteroidota bacterium]